MSFNEYNNTGTIKVNFGIGYENQPTNHPFGKSYSLAVEEMYFAKNNNDKPITNQPPNVNIPTLQPSIKEGPNLTQPLAPNAENQSVNYSNPRIPMSSEIFQAIQSKIHYHANDHVNDIGYESTMSKDKELMNITLKNQDDLSDKKTTKSYSADDLLKNAQQEYHYYNILLYFTAAFVSIYTYFYFLFFALLIITYSGYVTNAAIDTQVQEEQGSYSLRNYIVLSSLGFLRALCNLIFLFIGIKGFKQMNLKTNRMFIKFLEITIFFGLLGLSTSMFSGLGDVLYCLFTLALFFLLYKSCEGFTVKITGN